MNSIIIKNENVTNNNDKIFIQTKSMYIYIYIYKCSYKINLITKYIVNDLIP